MTSSSREALLPELHVRMDEDHVLHGGLLFSARASFGRRHRKVEAGIAVSTSCHAGPALRITELASDRCREPSGAEHPMFEPTAGPAVVRRFVRRAFGRAAEPARCRPWRRFVRRFEHPGFDADERSENRGWTMSRSVSRLRLGGDRAGWKTNARPTLRIDARRRRQTMPTTTLQYATSKDGTTIAFDRSARARPSSW